VYVGFKGVTYHIERVWLR